MEVIIMRGIPGSGKSTWIENFIKESGLSTRTEIVSADHFFVGCKTGEYKFDPSKLNEAHAACFKHFEMAIRYRNDFSNYLIVDNTNTKLWEMSPYIALANLHNVPVRIIRMGCNASIAAQRNIHGVPAKAVEAMSNRMESLLPFWPKEEHVQTS